MKRLLIFLTLIGLFVSMPAQNFISEDVIKKTISDVQPHTKMSSAMVTRGITQTAALWTEEDGTAEEFSQFCVNNFCVSPSDKKVLFQRLCDNFESILGYSNRLTVDLSLPIHVSGYQSLPVDEMFAAYDATAHLSNDLFANKIAFVITLNFPHYTLKEKSENAEKWSDLEWGYARLGDMFTARIPASVQQAITQATTAADYYISNYNIHMGKVASNEKRHFWGENVKLISHWGLRDELKAAYADRVNGFEKQRIIYAIMRRIIEQSIPKEVINSSKRDWYPIANMVSIGHSEGSFPPERNVRYQYLLNNFKAISAADKYYQDHSTYLDRRFNDELEFSESDIEKLFSAFLSRPEVKKVADLISKKLGRRLQPFDIWYNGFKNRSSIEESSLDAITRRKYPTKEAFVADLPHILQELGFTKEKADFICQHVTVDASVGAGHAWESRMRNDNARLRTRIGANGMDYKGFNIGIHEFGHNVEQTFSLHNVPNYFLSGVPNTAFTEAVAFSFQQRDLQLLGVTPKDTLGPYYELLDNFWSTYEIMGVSLLDIQVWKWMYAHPDADADALKEAVLSLAKEIWNQYYAPVFKVSDQIILAVYSHMIDSPLYLTAYPLGYLISFQLENYFHGKNLGTEVERMFSQGKLIPQYWLQKAVGSKLSVTPFVKAASRAVDVVSAYERAHAEAAKNSKKK